MSVHPLPADRTMPDPIRLYPAAWPVDAAADAGLVGLVPPTPNNPRGVRLTHLGPGDHANCAPGITESCTGCQTLVALCSANADAVIAALLHGLHCDACVSGGSL